MGKSKWAVVFLIHVHTPHQHILKGIVENVPEDATDDEVKRAVDRMGYTPGEFGVPWANHYVVPLAEAPDEVIGAYRQDNYSWRIDFEEALAPVE